MPEGDEQDNNRKTGLAYAAALALFFSVATFLGIGYLIDRWLGTNPWFLVGGVVLGSGLGLYEFVRITSKLS
jgi:ATP synthase protein I